MKVLGETFSIRDTKIRTEGIHNDEAGFTCVDPSKTARGQRGSNPRLDEMQDRVSGCTSTLPKLGLNLNLNHGQSFRIIYLIHLQWRSDEVRSAGSIYIYRLVNPASTLYFKPCKSFNSRIEYKLFNSEFFNTRRVQTYLKKEEPDRNRSKVGTDLNRHA
jgi:hypothetical protein